MEARQAGKERSSVIEFLKKSWKFLLGICVTILGGMLLFRKDNTGKIIEESTKAGDDALEAVKVANKTRVENDTEAEKEHEARLGRIEAKFIQNESNLNLKMRSRIRQQLDAGNAEKATAELAKFLGADNLDDI